MVEADIQGFFDPLDHDQRLERLALRIDDRAFLGLIRRWWKAGIVEADGAVIHPEEGAPQGGSVSPVLAKVYLHYRLDLWFEEVVKTHGRGEALRWRSADDWVGALRYRDDAERCYRVRPKRLGRFHLQVAPGKTRCRRFSRFHPSRKRRFTFLGFEFDWLEDRQGMPRVKRRTARQQLQAACRRIKDWIKDHRHGPGRECFPGLNRRRRGHYNYCGVPGNSRSLSRFFDEAIACPFKGLNRRGGKRRSFNWAQFQLILQRVGMARPRITAVKRQRVFA